MNSTTSRPKKSPLSKARKARPGRSAVRPSQSGGPALRREFRNWRASLPTALERETLLMPGAIAESVVQEAERFLQAELPSGFAKRLAAKAYHLYPRHKHFHKMLNRSGNRGRHNLYVYMRHWTCGWLKRERYALFKRLPWEYALGRRLPVTALGAPKIIRIRKI
jgi:hypothetical protein